MAEERLDLDAIKARRAAVGWLPWWSKGDEVWMCEPSPGFNYMYPSDDDTREVMTFVPNVDNAEFIAHAPSDVDDLIREVERLREAERDYDLVRRGIVEFR